MQLLPYLASPQALELYLNPSFSSSKSKDLYKLYFVFHLALAAVGTVASDKLKNSRLSLFALACTGAFLSVPSVMMTGGNWLCYQGFVKIIHAISIRSLKEGAVGIVQLIAGYGTFVFAEWFDYGFVERKLSDRYIRLRKSEAKINLKEFYREKQIVKGDEPINVEFHELGLDAKCQTTFQLILDHINQAIAENHSKPLSKKMKRKIGIALKVEKPLLPDEPDKFLPILQALVKKRVIFSVSRRGYQMDVDNKIQYDKPFYLVQT